MHGKVRRFATVMQRSFLVNLEQKLWKLVMIYKNYCEKFTATFCGPQNTFQFLT